MRLSIPLLSCLLASGLLAACASTPPPRPTHVTVKVDWTDPAKFTDTRTDQCHSAVAPEEWLGQLARYAQARARNLLKSGQTLEVTITDIQRAGQCEPWRGPRMGQIRMLTTIYPPMIKLHFQLRNADGTILAQGDRTLTDLAYLDRGVPFENNDPLRYEKRLLDDWLRRGVDKPPRR